jgi:ATP-dependent DNA helicase Rep
VSVSASIINIIGKPILPRNPASGKLYYSGFYVTFNTEELRKSLIPQLVSDVMCLMQLNEQQQAAIRTIDKPLLVLAGAGSGKTRVITEKILYLIQRCHYLPEKIVALTFTNKAAQEMQTRISSSYRDKSAADLTITTFHSLGLQIIRQEYAALNLTSRFSILDQVDAAHLLKQLLLDQQATFPIDELQSQISTWKNQLRTPDELLANAKTVGEQRYAKVYAAYRQALQAYHAVDFDDLLLMPVELFKSNPEILLKWQQKIRYLLVDEYQDTNLAQYALLKLLVGTHAHFTVVGDDDQAIYAWRGAQADNLAKLTEDFPSLEVIKLEQNYRSTQRILKVANHLIAQNPHLFEKKLWSQHIEGEKVRIVANKTSEDEVIRVVQELASHRVRFNKPYHHYAILYRSNHQARAFEQALREQQIPYHLSGGQSFFSHAEIKDILAYCRLLINPEDDMAFLRVINTPRRGIGTQTLQQLSTYAKKRHISLLAACGEFGLSTQISGSGLRGLTQFSDWIDNLSKQIENQTTIQPLQELIKDIDYTGWLQSNSKTPSGAERRQKNVQELLNWMQRLLAKDEKMNLPAVIQRLCILDMISQTSSTDTLDKVQLMTLHAAKGLEFPYVFLVGMEEDLLPHRNSILSNTIEEERRLLYVGITRAQEQLMLTYAEKRQRFRDFHNTKPSRFLAELPDEHLYWEGRNDKRDPEQKKQTGREHLAGLKALLNKE